MPRLTIISNGFNHQVLQLHLGVNRVGRNPENDFQIEHDSISARHCELVVASDHIVVRDCNSTNGTFFGGQRVKEAALATGQILRLGEVELFVDTVEVNIAIPKFSMPMAAPPIVLTDGGVVCPRHSQTRVTYQCTGCRELLCEACVHHLRRRGGKLFLFCPLCSRKVEPLADARRKHKSLLVLLQERLKPCSAAPRTNSLSRGFTRLHCPASRACVAIHVLPVDQLLFRCSVGRCRRLRPGTATNEASDDPRRSFG